MNRFVLCCWALVLAAWPVKAAPAPSVDLIKWHADRERMDADVDGVPLVKALGRISAATGWRVFVEPNTKTRVSAKFNDAKAGEALKLLLGNISFALITQTNSSPKLYVFRTALDLATDLVSAEREAKRNSAITNELVIRLKAGSRDAAEKLAASLHGKVVGRLDSLQAYQLRFADETATDAARQALGNSPDVASVDSNYAMEHPAPVNPASGGALNPFNLTAQAPADSGKVVVGLVDTPVQNINPAMQQFLLPAISEAGQAAAPNPDGAPTHGTAMAEILLEQIAQTAGNSGASTVRVLPVDVYGPNPSTTSFNVAEGIALAVQQGANVINLSLGGDGDSEVLHSVIQQAKSQGIEFFAAAGNQPVATPTYPAAYPEVVAVTAVNANGQPASYANFGPFVAAGVPGTALVPYESQTYAVTGTSTSTAMFSGAFATVAAANPNFAANPGQVFSQIQAQMVSQFAFKPPPAP
jgi:hypothetical protein